MTPSPENVRWADVPPPEQNGFVPIYSAKCGGAYELVCLGGELVGVWTHFANERTFPCVAGGPRACRCEFEALPKRWKGYIAAWEAKYSRCCLLELTADALHLANFEPRDVPQLRGRFLRLSRRGRARNGAVVVEVTSATHELAQLPPAFDVRGALCRVWFGRSGE